MDAIDKSVATNILDLNEDCLTEISEYLDFKDLFKFYEAHEHYHKSIERVVSRKIFTFEISDYKDSFRKEMEMISEFLTLFGKRLGGLKMKLPVRDYKEEEIASLLGNNIETLIESCCANGNIKYFSLENFCLSEAFIQDNSIFIRSLRSIEIENKSASFFYSGSWLKSLFLQLSNVTKIKMIADFNDNDRHIDEYLERINLGQLETLQLWGFDSGKNFDKLPISLSLKRLELPNCNFDPNLLVKHFPNLEYLEFNKESTTFSLEPFLELPKLKNFSLIYTEDAFKNVLAFLTAVANRNVLGTLKLRKSDVNRIFDNNYLRNEMILLQEISKMTNLKALELYLGPTCKQYLKELGSSLMCLHRDVAVQIHSKIIIRKILKFVKLAKKLEYLTLTMSPCENYEYLTEFYEKLERIRCNQKNQKVLYVEWVKPIFYTNISNLNFEGRYVKSAHRN